MRTKKSGLYAVLALLAVSCGNYENMGAETSPLPDADIEIANETDVFVSEQEIVDIQSDKDVQEIIEYECTDRAEELADNGGDEETKTESDPEPDVSEQMQESVVETEPTCLPVDGATVRICLTVKDRTESQITDLNSVYIPTPVYNAQLNGIIAGARLDNGEVGVTFVPWNPRLRTTFIDGVVVSTILDTVLLSSAINMGLCSKRTIQDAVVAGEFTSDTLLAISGLCFSGIVTAEICGVEGSVLGFAVSVTTRLLEELSNQKLETDLSTFWFCPGFIILGLAKVAVIPDEIFVKNLSPQADSLSVNPVEITTAQTFRATVNGVTDDYTPVDDLVGVWSATRIGGGGSGAHFTGPVNITVEFPTIRETGDYTIAVIISDTGPVGLRFWKDRAILPHPEMIWCDRPVRATTITGGPVRVKVPEPTCTELCFGKQCGTIGGCTCGNCQPNSCEQTWSQCTYEDVCDEVATQQRACTDYACQSNICVGSQYAETRQCSRETDGQTCSTITNGVCSNGLCIGRGDGCVAGTRLCNGNTVQVCATLNGTTVWVDERTCGADEQCTNGYCSVKDCLGACSKQESDNRFTTAKCFGSCILARCEGTGVPNQYCYRPVDDCCDNENGCVSDSRFGAVCAH